MSLPYLIIAWHTYTGHPVDLQARLPTRYPKGSSFHYHHHTINSPPNDAGFRLFEAPAFRWIGLSLYPSFPRST